MNHDNAGTTPLTFEALQAARAARTPLQHENDLAYAVAADIGLHARDLAEHYLASGDLASAHHLYRVATDHHTFGAADALADVETLLEVAELVDSTSAEASQTSTRASGTGDEDSGAGPDGVERAVGGDVERIAVLDDLADAAALVRRVRAHTEEHTAEAVRAARVITDNAREEAD